MGAQDIISALNGGLSQQDRLLKLDTPSCDETLLAQRAIGHARLGRQYEFTVDAISLSAGVELKKLIAQPVTLWLQQADKSYLPHHGYVHTARRLGSDSGLTSYQIGFASWLHFLRFRKDARIWQDKPADEILTDVFNEHPQARGAFRFALSKALPMRSFCLQYEDDWNFCHRLMESEGLFTYFEQAKDGKSHTLIVTDDIGSLDTLEPSAVNFYRAGTNSETDALVQWSGSRTLQSTTLTTRTFDYKRPSSAFNPQGTSVPTHPGQGTLPAQAEVYEYTGAYTYGEQTRGDQLSTLRMEEWESRAKRFHGVGALRRAEVGHWFELDGHPEHGGGDRAERKFAVIDVAWYIENNLPVSVSAQPFPHSLASRLAEAKAQLRAAGLPDIEHADGSVGFVLVEIEAQRRAVPFRSPLEHHKPAMSLQTAIVVGPENEEVYTDELNRIKVRMHWDRRAEDGPQSSCWMRVAFSDTGSGYGSVHVPRVGEEVIVDWVDGDCDRPIVTGRVYNGAKRPQWHSNGLLSGYRSKEYQGSGYNHFVMDDATGQSRAQLYSSSANSLLHLGYLIEQNGNTRGAYLGSGFDLKSDAWGAVRAGRGLYVSTYAKAATSQPLDVSDSHTQLVNAQSVIDAMSQASQTHQAESLNDGHDALKAFSDATQSSVTGAAGGGLTAGGGTGSANAFDKPVMLFGSPSGIALSTQASTQVSADRHVNLVAGQSVHIATGKSLLAGVTERISLFVQNAGMKLFAAKGKIEIRAHSDNIELTAQKSVKVISATDTIEAAAQQEVLLTSGGAYIRIKGGNIEIHAPGNIDIKGAQHAFAGPVSNDYALPALPQGALTGMQSLRFATYGSDQLAQDIGWVGKPFSIVDGSGTVVQSGQIASDGRLPRTMLEASDSLTLKVGSDNWDAHPVQAAQVDDAPEAAELAEDDNPYPVDMTAAQFLTQADLTALLSSSVLAQTSRGEA
ncbi:type VI secretion system tip protein VgrG [Paraburkholderia sp. Tr-20389]|uniref:type VI secretion system Vgr family protein n=1 Tax=Paraburkholderia sp. Tr-20389 TaxID=2703903 RepID=UPI0019820044|nr:type VI secretion system Vgr family protein [Paraburkholderia sp. Tr-20389]MBN3757851.1 type VI secretion system tip protein VgrG [Paraburkholderia sp. Tr-20389]